jgi:NAD(P)-dependent dehydrogenase (short-subunit alcohol dehydrogenase family)
MKNFKGKTAVITGAASGIGLALARRAGAAGMRLVLADIDEKSLRDAANALPRTDDCVQVVSDVSIEEDMARLARQTFERFGAVHLLFNNAGVVLARPLVGVHSQRLGVVARG